MHTCIHHGDHDWWTLVTHVRSLEWVSELIMIWHVLSLRDVGSGWLTLLTAFRYTLTYTDWLHHGPAKWSLIFHPRFFHIFQDRHVWTIDPFIVVRAMICPIETSIGFLGCTQCRGRRRLPSSQKGAGSMLRNHQRGVSFVVLGVIMKGPCVRNVWPVWQFWVFNSYRCGVNHFKVATSNSFRHEKRGRHLEADSRVVGAHWIIPWFFVEFHWNL